MIDKNFRLFGKVSIVDILMLIILVIFIYFAIQFSAPQSVSAKTTDAKIKYTIEIYKREPFYVENLNVGDQLIDNLKTYKIGTITNFYDEPYLEVIADKENDVFKHAEIDGMRNIYIEVEADARIDDYVTAIGQYEIQVGKSVFVRTSQFAGAGYVVKIERLD